MSQSHSKHEAEDLSSTIEVLAEVSQAHSKHEAEDLSSTIEDPS